MSLESGIQNSEFRMRNWELGIGKFFIGILILLLSLSAEAQEVRTSVDTTAIKIGEQITYGITVEAEAEDMVVFPEGQTFEPMEMVESFPVDTSKVEGKFELLKKYALTQWDSGSYSIPQQKIIINNREFLTDSLLIEVNNVVVDTTKQKLFPIKPAVEVPSRFEIPIWAWWLLAVIVLGVLIFLFFRRKRKKEEAAKRLPPYEQAILELKKLDESHLLENREIKEYYSQLSAAVRRYLDEEVFDHAMESTTGELVAYLEAEKSTGKLNIDQKTIDNLKQILQRADLAKFANSKPDMITAKEDRSRAEFVINDTKQGIPQPTEEELLQDQLYREKLEKKRKKKNMIIAISTVLVLLIALTGYLAATKGFGFVKDTYFGNESKDLLQGDWIQSEYGYPPVTIVTPEVLTRGEIEMADEVEEMMVGSQTFMYGGLFENYLVALTTIRLGQASEFELDKAVDGVYGYLEKQGARNIILKQEEFRTVNGGEGLKVFGTMEVENPETGKVRQKEYAILNFGESNGFQQITIIHNEDDKYAEEITDRILGSVELINTGNDVQ